MLNQWFKLAILALVGIIVSSLAIGVVSGLDKQSAPAAGIFSLTGGSNGNHNAGADGNHGPDANDPYGYPGPNTQYGPGFGPNRHQGPNGFWGLGYGPGMGKMPGMNVQENVNVRVQMPNGMNVQMNKSESMNNMKGK